MDHCSECCWVWMMAEMRVHLTQMAVWNLEMRASKMAGWRAGYLELMMA